MFVQTWWAYFTLLQSPLCSNLFAFLLPLTVFVVLYLICASALPDVSKAVEGAEVDLRTFYLDQHRYFFSLWAVLLLLAALVSALTRGGFQLVVDGFRIAGFAAAVLPAWSGHRRVHGIVTVAALAALILYIVLFRLKLGAGIIVSRWA
jgi:hypothetical protein